MDDLLRATARAEARHFWFRGFRSFVHPLIQQALGGVRQARALDCGCGTGVNLALLSPYATALGLDITAVGLEFARQRGANALVRASAAGVPFLSDCFDLVTSFDVLYALDERDEAAAAAEMFRVIRPGGYAIVNVAAMDVLHGDHSILSHERRRYSRTSLSQLLTSAGFRIVRITYTNAALFLPLLAVRAFHRARGLASEADATSEISVPPAPINALLTVMLWMESMWLRAGGSSPFGSSLLCLARKPEAATLR